MNDESFTTTFTVDQSPKEVFDAINDVRGWWGEIRGRTDVLGAVFEYSNANVHLTTHEITELVPGKRVVWHVTDSFLHFIQDEKEWRGTDIVFEIAKKGDETEVRFTHLGLVPEFECFETCKKGWTFYVQESLRALITTGKGKPSTPAAERRAS
jgi:uncharacterized protein YndB with AHSA1/START domain